VLLGNGKHDCHNLCNANDDDDDVEMKKAVRDSYDDFHL